MANILRFPSRVTGAMRLYDPLDYTNEGDVRPCDCEPREPQTNVIALPQRRRISPVELWFSLALTFTAAVLLMWQR